MRTTARYIAHTSALISLTISIIIIGYWVLLPVDDPIFGGGGIVRFNTAICLTLSSIALLLLNRKVPTKQTRKALAACCSVVLAISLVTLLEYYLDKDLLIDFLFYKEKSMRVTTAYPGRISESGAIMFILLCSSMLMTLKRRLHLVVQIILMLSFTFLSLLTLIFITQASMESQLAKPSPLYTSIALLLLFLGTFFCAPMSYLRFSLQKRIAGFITYAILLLLIAFFTFIYSARQSEATTRAVDHTTEVLSKTNEVLTAALNIETGARGFIISGEEVFLEPFTRSSAAIFNSLSELKLLTSDNPAQRPKLDSLEKLVIENIRLRQEQIILIRNNQPDSVKKIFSDGINRLLMDQLRSVISRIQSEENKMLAERKRTNAVTGQQTYNVIILFQVVTAILLIIAFIVIYQNVRSRNRAEEEIRNLNETLEKKVEQKSRDLVDSELHFRNILDNLLEGVQIIGFDWKYNYVNDSFLKHSKYSREELLGYTVMEKFPGIEETNIYSVYQECFKKRVAIHLENEFVFPDGSMGWFELSFQPVPEGIFILSMDISERKRSEQALVEMNQVLDRRAGELETSNSELERFAYVASHDLQEPLRMVSSFLHLLERKLGDSLDATNKQYIDFAVDGAERMKVLIQDLLQYSRVGTSKDAISRVDCNAVMDTVRAVLSLSLQESDTRLVVHPLPVVKAVNAQMLQLFQNLVSNAIKYRKPEEQTIIEVGCTEIKGYWEFYVKDNGIGIDPKFFDKIFIIFQRLHNKAEYSGTGIGLSICKKIVEKHGGSIRVESATGKGSTFYFTIPKP